MVSSPQFCAVSGATGYVGSLVCEHFATRGWTVFEFSRRRSSDLAPGRVHVPFQLDSPIDPSVFRQNRVGVLIHCAYDFRPLAWAEIHRINVEGSARLLRAAKDGGVGRIILLSSISAFEGCSSHYGRAKLEIERVAADLGAFVVRPGLVYGGPISGGMFGSLQGSVAKAAIVPLVGSGRQMQYLVHVQDLCELLVAIGSENTRLPRGPILAASRHGWQIRDLLQVLAAEQHANVTFIVLPWQIIWLALKAAELLGIRVPFRSDSVVSLVRQNPHPDFSLSAHMGCTFRDFVTALR